MLYHVAKREEMKIKCAAIMANDGRIFEGRSHGEVIKTYGQDGKFKGKGTTNQGFVTDKGNFVGRHEAARIAIAAGQVKRDKLHKGVYLMSEDLDLDESSDDVIDIESIEYPARYYVYRNLL
jgi:hypothetical protein